MSMKLAATVTMQLELDVTGMVKQAAAQARSVAGAGPLSEAGEQELLAKALEAMARDAKQGGEELRRRTREALPEGITLLELSQSQKGPRVCSTMRFELSDLKLLPKIAVAMEGDGAAHPFSDFKVSHQGKSVVVEGATPSLPAPPEAKGALRLELSTQAPARQHSATSAKGTSLVWEGALGAKPLPVHATYAV